ncbi:HD domain-containing protein [Aquimarina sp. BL5]|uniref:HD domain-containing protein n=1 Tax=Aquimarina sp. BL5 TaxID=1714860 RepID=UPI000E46C5DD|nr:HD domain-containing protein [Aquimarina sp. BL5]AXT51742.1 HD domain-containing protein [Aquimarina sp. BL5]RKM99548.1 HD domain-containing protein [Aquimarina sp. BL5]
MIEDQIISKTVDFVKNTLHGAEGGHDWFHIQRVFKTSQNIAKDEDVDFLIVSLGALLHDIADSKFHNGDETIGPKVASDFLVSIEVDKRIIDHVVLIIENISFKGGNTSQKFKSPELDVIQDADRLDAIGAIGVARCFNYGGFKNRVLYDPEIAPNLTMTKEEYKSSTAPTINHFYEKLLLLKDRMNTKTGKKIAEERHRFMEVFLEQFYREWEGQ